MQKREWAYYGHLKQHLVELLHLPDADRVVIKLNGAVLFDEQLPLGNGKTFSFFIDDEFCEIKIAAQDKRQYQYDFIAHRFSTTSFGKQQKWQDRLQKIGVAGGIIALFTFFLIPVGYYLLRQQTVNNDFNAGGISTPAQVIRIELQERNTPIDSLPLVRTRLYYSYHYQKHNYTAETTQWLYLQNDTVYTPAGLPLFKDDAFEVLFAAQNPTQNQLRLDRPTDVQLGKYWLFAREKCTRNRDPLPPATDKNQYCDCLLYELVNQYDLVALAQFYHQFDPPTPRLRYHRTTYEQWMGQRNIRILMSNCATNPLRQ